MKLESWEVRIAKREGIHCRKDWIGITPGIGKIVRRNIGERFWKVACGTDLIGFSDKGKVRWILLFEGGQILNLERKQALSLLHQ